MRAVVIPLILLLILAVAVILLATLSARQRGEELLTEHGEATVDQFRRRSAELARGAGRGVRRVVDRRAQPGQGSSAADSEVTRSD